MQLTFDCIRGKTKHYPGLKVQVIKITASILQSVGCLFYSLFFRKGDIFFFKFIIITEFNSLNLFILLERRILTIFNFAYFFVCFFIILTIRPFTIILINLRNVD